MTLKEKLVTACAVLILGAAVGWCAVQISLPPKPMLPEPEPEAKVSIFDLSDEAWAKLEYVLRDER